MASTTITSEAGPANESTKQEKELTNLIESLSKTYKYALMKESTDRYRTIWSKPTPQQPLASPVVNVYFNIHSQSNSPINDHNNNNNNDRNQNNRIENKKITFQLENQQYQYSSREEIDFDRALGFIVRSKQLVAQSVGIQLV